jgi:hypothetical protein
MDLNKHQNNYDSYRAKLLSYIERMAKMSATYKDQEASSIIRNLVGDLMETYVQREAELLNEIVEGKKQANIHSDSQLLAEIQKENKAFFEETLLELERERSTLFRQCAELKDKMS